jgi:hypothetical protein
MLDEARIHDTTYLAAQAALLTSMRDEVAWQLNRPDPLLEEIEAKELRDRASRQDPLAQIAVVYGTEQAIQTMAANVRLGAAERERRNARRQQQKASRRANR